MSLSSASKTLFSLKSAQSNLGRWSTSFVSLGTCLFWTAFSYTTKNSAIVFGQPLELVKHSVIKTPKMSLSSVSNAPFALKSSLQQKLLI